MAAFAGTSGDVYLATELLPGPVDREDSEEDMRHRLVPEQAFRRMARAGLVRDGASLAAYARLLLDRL